VASDLYWNRIIVVNVFFRHTFKSFHIFLPILVANSRENCVLFAQLAKTLCTRLETRWSKSQRAIFYSRKTNELKSMNLHCFHTQFLCY